MSNVYLEVNGIRYEGWKSLEVYRAIDTIAGEFNFTTSSQNPISYPIKAGDKCSIFIDNHQVIDGFVENLEISYSASSHDITLSGRDRTADIIDSSLTDNIEFNSAISLKNIIKRIVAKVGFTDMDVIDKVGDIKLFSTADVISGEQGETAFDVIEKYCKKRQVICNTDGQGNIVLTRASKDTIPTILSLNRGNPQNNNIKAASCSFSDVSKYNTITVYSQANSSVFTSTFSPDELDIKGVAVDTSVRNTRKLSIISDTSLDQDSAAKRAVWDVNIRRARALTYRAVVRGFSYDDNNLWDINNLVTVDDQLCSVSSDLLVKNVRYTLDIDGGSQTELELTYPDAFTLATELPKAQENSLNIFDDFRS